MVRYRRFTRTSVGKVRGNKKGFIHVKRDEV